jgi:hypothetical protein
MTVDGSGRVTGVSVGSATISSTFAPIYTSTGNICVESGAPPPSCPTYSPQQSAPATVTPTILLGGSNGTDITNTTQNAVVGQQIVLYGSYTLPSGYTFSSQSWMIPGTTVGGFTTTSNSGGPTPTDFSQQSNTFYWVVAGNSQQVTFTLNYVDNQSHNQTATATATFNVAGPTNVQIQFVAQGAPQFLNNGTTNASIEFGDPTGTSGIQWTASATSPSQVAGTYRWAQIIANNSYTYTVGTTTTPCAEPPGLDNQFPLSITTGTFTDSPDRALPSTDSKFTWSWDATTFFMWNPGINNSSIWVPIAQREWKFYADVTQNLSTNIWTVQSDSTKFVGAPQIGYSPIQWNAVELNGHSACP